MAEIKARVDPAIKKKIASMVKKEDDTKCFYQSSFGTDNDSKFISRRKNRFEEMLGMHIEMFATFAKSNDELLKTLISIEGVLNREVQKLLSKR
ncbi:hypothetical protein EYB33_00525 (plasmid) [Lysinibacillus sphaericus]|uniref:hypothetical protein n=1 Tax=Lysinibacillus sphaericus TaxID=1421 RepID=UPI001E60B37F|nr:hypothetical protein [Lysinibacillus sphaericus]UDK94871.1 hypothetical protein EYB33_00525 [Lysinibacillus sphaericus]